MNLNSFKILQSLLVFTNGTLRTYLLGNSQETNKVLVTTYIITLFYSFCEIILFSTSNLQNKKGVFLSSCQFEKKLKEFKNKQFLRSSCPTALV